MTDRTDASRFERLRAVVAELAVPGGFERIDPCPAADDLPPPWLTWTWIGLLRHLRRQRWVGRIVRERLDGDLGQIAAYGWAGHPPGRPTRGIVPGLPEWEYDFHGIGCCLTHRMRGDRVDVDFFGDHAEGFEPCFYVWYLESLREPEPPEARLIELLPSDDAIRLAMELLLRAGVCVDNGRDGLQLAEGYSVGDEVVAAIETVWADPAERAETAARLGDWPAALAAQPPDADPDVRALHVARSAAVRAAWVSRLRAEYEGGAKQASALVALRDAAVPDLARLLTAALRDPASGATWQALEILAERPASPAHHEDVYALVLRTAPTGQPPAALLWARSLALLFRWGHRLPDLTAALRRAGAGSLGEASLIALEFVPAHAPALLRRALRSSVPYDRTVAAATLALFDEPWSRRELAAVLDESDDDEATFDCRAAVEESREPAVRALAAAWEARRPADAPIPDRWFDPVAVFRLRMNALRGRLDPLRSRLRFDEASQTLTSK